MKNIVKVCVLCMFSITLLGCGRGNPGMSDKDYETGKEILNIVDDYLDGKITDSETSRKIGSLINDLEETDQHITFMVKSTAQSIEIGLDNSDSTSKIEESRDELAGYLNR